MDNLFPIKRSYTFVFLKILMTRHHLPLILTINYFHCIHIKIFVRIELGFFKFIENILIVLKKLIKRKVIN